MKNNETMNMNQQQQRKKDVGYEDRSRSDYETIFSEIVSLSDALKSLIEEVRLMPAPQMGEVSSRL